MKQKYIRLFNKIKRVNLYPQSEWDVILTEPESSGWYLKQLVFPCILAATAATLLGYLFLAATVGNYSFVYAFIKSVAIFCELFFSFYVSSLLVIELCPRLKIAITYEQLFRLMAYSLTGFWFASAIAGIMANYPTLGSFLKFLGIYGMYPFLIGSAKMGIGDKNKRNKLMLICLISIIVTYLLINWSFGFVLRSMHYAFLFNQE